MEGHTLLMIVIKYFWHRDRDFKNKNAESLIIKSQKYFTLFSARLASCDVVWLTNIQVHVHLQVVLSGQLFKKLKISVIHSLPLLKIYGKKYNVF